MVLWAPQHICTTTRTPPGPRNSITNKRTYKNPRSSTVNWRRRCCRRSRRGRNVLEDEALWQSRGVFLWPKLRRWWWYSGTVPVSWALHYPSAAFPSLSQSELYSHFLPWNHSLFLSIREINPIRMTHSLNDWLPDTHPHNEFVGIFRLIWFKKTHTDFADKILAFVRSLHWSYFARSSLRPPFGMYITDSLRSAECCRLVPVVEFELLCRWTD